MASHDFCLGCPKCDREAEEHAGWTQINRLEDAIEELEKLDKVSCQSAIKALTAKIKKIRKALDANQKK